MSSCVRKVFAVTFLWVGLIGCQRSPLPCDSLATRQSSLEDLRREREDDAYEMGLRQTELNLMQANVRGSVGLSSEWLTRKTDLEEKIIGLRVKVHDLDIRIEGKQ